MLVQNLPIDCESYLHIIKIRVKVYCEAPSRRLNKELVMTITYFLATQKKEALTIPRKREGKGGGGGGGGGWEPCSKQLPLLSSLAQPDPLPIGESRAEKRPGDMAIPKLFWRNGEVSMVTS